MADDDGGITIIKKKKKVIGGGHHGGAWKVAYADFVTAMMAFFLLMWLLNATTEKQRKGLADYFTPTIPIHSTSGGGNGVFDGQTIVAQNELVAKGRGADSRQPSAERQDKGNTGFSSDEETKDGQSAADDVETLSEVDDEMNRLEGMLVARSGESEFDDDQLDHVRTKITDEGLVIELFDIPEARLFDGLSDTPTPVMQDLIATVAKVATQVTNKIAVVGHSFAGGGRGDSAADWYLSSNRAQTARRLLISSGTAPNRIQRVTGKADRQPGFEELSDPRNNRIEIILLR